MQVKKVMFTFVALLSAGLLGAAAACSCFPPQPGDPKCGRDDQYVLVGVGISNEPIPCVYADVPEEDRDDIFFGLQDGVTLAKFRVTAVLSQPPGGMFIRQVEADDVVEIRSGVASNLCGYQVQPDVEYVLFTSARDPEDCEGPQSSRIPPDQPSLEAAPLTLEAPALQLGTGLCSGNIREPTEAQLAQLEADCNEAPPPPTSNGDFEGLAIIDIASGATVRLNHLGQETVDLTEYPEGLGIQAEFLDNDLVESVTFETDAGYSHTEFKFTYDMFGTNGGGAWPDLIPGRVTLTVTARFTDGNEAQHETVLDFEGPVPEVTRVDRGFEE